MTLDIEHTHSLQMDDARARMRALGDYLSNKYGIGVTWVTDDEARFSGKYLVVTIDGAMTITPSKVRFSGKDPGMLWRGKAKEYLGAKLEKYLNPNNSPDALPRG